MAGARVRQIAMVHAADGATTRVTLSTATAVVVGREPGPGGLAILDREISRKHAVFEPDGAGWRVTDLGSRNGIVVDGVPSPSAPLRHGSVVRIGGAVLVFVDEEGERDPAAPLSARRDEVVRLSTTWLAERHPGMTLSSAAAEALCLYAWPHDVRQLEQVLASSSARAASVGVIAVDHMPPHVAEPLLSRLGVTLPPQDAHTLALDVDPSQANPPAEDLEKALRHFAGSVADVAAFFNRERRQVHRWLKRHGIDPERFREPAPPTS